MMILPRGWFIGERKEGRGEGKRKIHLPAVIVLLGNSVRGQTEFLIVVVLMLVNHLPVSQRSFVRAHKTFPRPPSMEITV